MKLLNEKSPVLHYPHDQWLRATLQHVQGSLRTASGFVDCQVRKLSSQTTYTSGHNNIKQDIRTLKTKRSNMQKVCKSNENEGKKTTARNLTKILDRRPVHRRSTRIRAVCGWFFTDIGSIVTKAGEAWLAVKWLAFRAMLARGEGWVLLTKMTSCAYGKKSPSTFSRTCPVSCLLVKIGKTDWNM